MGMEQNSAQTSNRTAYLKARTKDFIDATAFFDSVGFEVQETHAPTILWGMVNDDMVIVENALSEGLDQLRRIADEVEWLREDSQKKAKELIQPLI